MFWLPEGFVEEELEEDFEEELEDELEEVCVLCEPLELPTPLEEDMGDTSSKRRADSSPSLLVEQ